MLSPVSAWSWTRSFVRRAALGVASGRYGAEQGAFPPQFEELIERIFRSTHILVTLKRDELIREGGGVTDFRTWVGLWWITLGRDLLLLNIVVRGGSGTLESHLGSGHSW